MKKVIVLGCGLVGGPMAMDLADCGLFETTVADISAEALKKLSTSSNVSCVEQDLSDTKRLTELISNFDYVINAVPGFMGYETLKTIIKAKKDCIDIAFFAEDAGSLHKLALENNVCVITDMGVAPGMSHLLTGFAHHQLDEMHKVRIFVGGLPRERTWPYEYKAVFSPSDVIEEYTRPARLVENSAIIEKPALSDPELLEFKGVGTLEAFNSDGLRSLVYSIKAADMAEKTLRYKGHIEIMKVLRETGFFDKQAIAIGDAMISPLEFTSKLLFPKWKLEKGEKDITVMRIRAEGLENGQEVAYQWDLYDEADEKSGVHSMARTTGYAATSALRMMHKGIFRKPGVYFPEVLGKEEECVDYLLSDQADRNILYQYIKEKL